MKGVYILVKSCNNFLMIALPIVATILCVLVFLSMDIHPNEDTTHRPTTDTVVIHKNYNNNSFKLNCVADSTERFHLTDGKLFYFFYVATGIQPYINVKGYDPSLSDDVQKDSFAKVTFDTTIADPDGLFIMCFDEGNHADFSIVCGSHVRSQCQAFESLLKKGLRNSFADCDDIRDVFTGGLQYVLDNILIE